MQITTLSMNGRKLRKCVTTSKSMYLVSQKQTTPST